MSTVVSMKDVKASRIAALKHEEFMALSQDIGLSQQAFCKGMTLLLASMLMANAALLRYFLPR